MKIFLDVGAYIGDTAKAVLTSKHHFDKIYCFEPQLSLCDIIKKINNDKIIVCEFGLWNRDCTKTLFYVQRRPDGASIYSDKFAKRDDSSVECRFVKASIWFSENIKPDDYVVLKLNCEGAECDILDDLFQSGEYKKINALMVDFDVRKSPSQKHKENEIREKLLKYHIPAVFLVGDVEESMWGHSLHNCYYLKKEKWTHYWMNKIL